VSRQHRGVLLESGQVEAAMSDREITETHS